MKYTAAFSVWTVSLTSSVAAYTAVSGIYPLNATQSSIATTYGGNWPGGMCSFSDYPHVGLNGVALGKEQWFGAAGCGACIKITGASGSVIAMVNDQCPECVDNHLDLDEAYAAQVDVNFRTKGIFDIKWQFVPCPVTGNLQFKNKEGTSAWYFAVQVRNSRLPIDTLEVSTNSGATWTSVNREPYNFFTPTADLAKSSTSDSPPRPTDNPKGNQGVEW
ncbi:expansin-yoaJ [Ceratobasidium sp. AG-Ba]|nr:expansin-yoaJ [Ceratobasidium sp. AG-Ba]